MESRRALDEGEWKTISSSVARDANSYTPQELADIKVSDESHGTAAKAQTIGNALLVLRGCNTTVVQRMARQVQQPTPPRSPALDAFNTVVEHFEHRKTAPIFICIALLEQVAGVLDLRDRVATIFELLFTVTSEVGSHAITNGLCDVFQSSGHVGKKDKLIAVRLLSYFGKSLIGTHQTNDKSTTRSRLLRCMALLAPAIMADLESVWTTGSTQSPTRFAIEALDSVVVMCHLLVGNETHVTTQPDNPSGDMITLSIRGQRTGTENEDTVDNILQCLLRACKLVSCWYTTPHPLFAAGATACAMLLSATSARSTRDKINFVVTGMCELLVLNRPPTTQFDLPSRTRLRRSLEVLRTCAQQAACSSPSDVDEDDVDEDGVDEEEQAFVDGGTAAREKRVSGTEDQRGASDSSGAPYTTEFQGTGMHSRDSDNNGDITVVQHFCIVALLLGRCTSVVVAADAVESADGTFNELLSWLGIPAVKQHPCGRSLADAFVSFFLFSAAEEGGTPEHLEPLFDMIKTNDGIAAASVQIVIKIARKAPEKTLDLIFEKMHHADIHERRNLLRVLEHMVGTDANREALPPVLKGNLCNLLLDRFGDDFLSLRTEAARILARLDPVYSVARLCTMLANTDARVRSAAEQCLLHMLRGTSDVVNVLRVLLATAHATQDTPPPLHPGDIFSRHVSNSGSEEVPGDTGSESKRTSRILRVLEKWTMEEVAVVQRVPHPATPTSDSVSTTPSRGRVGVAIHDWAGQIAPFVVETVLRCPSDATVVQMATRLAPRLGVGDCVVPVLRMVVRVLAEQPPVDSAVVDGDDDHGTVTKVLLFQRLSPLLVLRMLPVAVFVAGRDDVFHATSTNADASFGNDHALLLDQLWNVVLIRLTHELEFKDVRKVAAELLSRFAPCVSMVCILDLTDAMLADTAPLPMPPARTADSVPTASHGDGSKLPMTSSTSGDGSKPTMDITVLKGLVYALCCGVHQHVNNAVTPPSTAVPHPLAPRLLLLAARVFGMGHAPVQAQNTDVAGEDVHHLQRGCIDLLGLVVAKEIHAMHTWGSLSVASETTADMGNGAPKIVEITDDESSEASMPNGNEMLVSVLPELLGVVQSRVLRQGDEVCSYDADAPAMVCWANCIVAATKHVEAMLSPPAPLLAVLFHSTCSGILAVLADPTQGPRTQAACAQALFVTCYHLRETTVADESIADIVGVCVQMLTTATSPDSTNAARSTAGRGACVASKSPASTAVARIGAVKLLGAVLGRASVAATSRSNEVILPGSTIARLRDALAGVSNLDADPEVQSMATTMLQAVALL